MRHSLRGLATAAGVATLLTLTIGCAHVNRDELQTELSALESDLRQEVRTGDAQLADRIDTVDGRVDGLQAHLADLDARTATLENDLQALAADVGATVQRLENAIAFNAPVHFDYDSAEVRESDAPLLERFAEVAHGYYPDSLITVEGFTDPAGSEAYNQKLGLARADSVKTLLSEHGIEPARLRTVSYGEAENRQVLPGAQGPGEAGLMNRRVTLVIETSNARWDTVAEADGEITS